MKAPKTLAVLVCVAALGVVAVWTIGDAKAPIDARANALEPAPPAALDRTGLDSSAIPAATPRTTTAEPDAPPVREPAAKRPPAVAADDCCIVGRVVDAEGTPIADAKVSALAFEPDDGGLFSKLEPPARPLEAKSRADGSFSIDVPAAQAFSLKVVHEKLAPATRAALFAGDSVEIVLGAGAVLRVRVRALGSTANTAPAGTRIVATLGAAGTASTWWKLESNAGQAGESVFTGVPAGTIDVSARASGFPLVTTTVQSVGSGEIACEIMLPEPAVIEGTVIDRASGRAIRAAKVGCAGLGWTYTNQEGLYRIDNVAPSNMTWGVSASAPGHSIAYEYVLAEASGRRAKLDFALDAAQRARGRVVDTHGSPVANARVCYVMQLATMAFVGETHRGEVFTNVDGKFEINDLHAGVEVRLLVLSEEHGKALFDVGPFAPSRDAAELGDFVVAAPGSITGEVRCPRKADERVRVRLEWLGEGRAAHVASAHPDTRGRFTFTSLAPGKYKVELVTRPADGGRDDERVAAVQSLEVVRGEAPSHVVLECASNEITGRVVDPADRAIGECVVSLVDPASPEKPLATTRTDPAGRFQIVADAAGPFRLDAADPRLFHESASIDGVRPGDRDLALVLTPFRSTFSIRGRIVDTSGGKPANVYIAFRDTQTNERLERVALPDESGRFEMRDLRDRAYDLELMDFKNRYKPAKLANVRPSGDDVELRIEPRE